MPLYETLPLLVDSLHLLDLLDLAQTCSRMEKFLAPVISARWECVEVSDDSIPQNTLDGYVSELFLYGDIAPLARSRCERVAVHGVSNEALAGHLFFKKLFKKVKQLIISRFDFALGFFSESLEVLRMGVHGWDPPSFPLVLPSLRELYIVGFPVGAGSEHYLWLLDLLASTKGNLRRIMINFSIVGEVEQEIPEAGRPWDSSHLLHLEIVCDREFSTAKTSKIASNFVDFIIGKTDAFPQLHTVHFNTTTSPLILSVLCKCTSLLHVVLSRFSPADLALFGKLIDRNKRHLQILVLRIPGKSSFHFDSFFQLVLAAEVPLQRLDIEVVMDSTSGVMDVPYHTLKACLALRCRYPSHMYFRRGIFSVALGTHKAVCVEEVVSEEPPPLLPGPVDLFAEEMLRGMYSSKEELESNMFTEWNSAGQLFRAKYVDIFDEYVEDQETDRPPPDWTKLLDDSSGGKTDTRRHVPARE